MGRLTVRLCKVFFLIKRRLHPHSSRSDHHRVQHSVLRFGIEVARWNPHNMYFEQISPCEGVPPHFREGHQSPPRIAKTYMSEKVDPQLRRTDCGTSFIGKHELLNSME